MNWSPLFAVLSACLLAGCRTDSEVIRFSSEPTPPSETAADAEGKAPRKLSKLDFFEIKQVVYDYLLQRHFWDDNEYSAVFLEGDDDEVAALIKKFPGHIPPIKISRRAELFPNRTPIDKDTGRPAIVFSVDALDPVEGRVEAVGKWYAGGAVSGFYIFTLQKKGSDWVRLSVK